MLRFDLPALRALLVDYFANDLWDTLDDPEAGAVELVIADRSPTFTDDDKLRLARAPSHVHAHHIDAGHWLHIDAPAQVIDVLSQRLA